MKRSNELKQLVDEAAESMEKLGYSPGTMRHYWEVWNRYLKFTKSITIDKSDMDTFLAKIYGIVPNTKESSRYQRNAIRALNVIKFYSDTGKIYVRFPLSNPVTVSTCFDLILENFISSLSESGYADSTIHTHEVVIKRFLDHIYAAEVKEVIDINYQHIAAFILEITSRRGKATYELNSLRVFFRFLTRRNLHPLDLTFFLPASNKLRVREHLPMIWNEDDLEAIFRSIDQNNPVGKRDYAMMLLALRLGLRSIDVKNLCFSDIDWEKETITIKQQKTQETIIFPLSNELGSALINYLQDGRPISDYPNIFLTLRPPYRPFSRENHLHQLLNKYVNRSGVTLTVDKAHGMHSLRHTLASNLLKQGTSISIISEILGHQDSQTTMEYLRIDKEQLRDCTLEMEASDDD